MMRTLSTVVSVLFLLLAALAAQAQSTGGTDDVYVQQVARDAPRALATANNERIGERFDALFSGLPGAGRLLRARPDDNGATVNQRGTGHRVAVTQTGAANRAAIRQQGAGHQTILRQEGTGNRYGATLEGTGNATRALQRGDHNRYFLSFQGQNLDHAVQQLGDRNTLVQIGAGDGRRPASVRQKGNGMAILIRHSGAPGTSR